MCLNMWEFYKKKIFVPILNPFMNSVASLLIIELEAVSGLIYYINWISSVLYTALLFFSFVLTPTTCTKTVKTLIISDIRCDRTFYSFFVYNQTSQPKNIYVWDR